MPEETYYLPGRVVMTIQHSANLNADQLLGLLQKVEEFQGMGIVFPDLPALVKSFFSRARDHVESALSFVPANLRAGFSVINVVEALWALTNEGRPTDIVQTENGSIIVVAPGHEPPAGAIVVFRLMGFSPDFIIGGATHQVVGGGPGGFPNRVAQPAAIPGFTLPVDAALDGPAEDPNTGEGVMVVILDSAPSMNVMADVPVYWTNHPLAQQLRPAIYPAPAGQLSVHPASAIELFPLSHCTLQGQRYLMPDHGLFVAGIINTIVPDAEMHLVEALNQYGTGSATTLISALYRATLLPRAPGIHHVVINCSVILRAWSPALVGLDPVFANPLMYASFLRSLSMQFDILVPQGFTIVASSGNDSAGAVPALPPENPAAFASVISVGSLRRIAARGGGIFQRAPYSNRADRPAVPPAVNSNGVVIAPALPPKDGILVFGGEPAPGQGVLGIFLGNVLDPVIGYIDDPDTQPYTPNTSGWADWAGTSFAAPIISAMCVRLASAMGAGATNAQVQADLFNLAAGTIESPLQHVIEVTQP